MRILLVVPHHHHEERSRASKRVQRMIAGLDATEHEVSVVTGKWWGQSAPTYHHRRSTQYAAGRGHLSPLRVAKRIRELRPDVIHTIDVPAGVIAAGAISSRVPLIYELTGFEAPLLHSRFSGQLDRFISRFFVPSEITETVLMAKGFDTGVDRIPDSIHREVIPSTRPLTGVDIAWSAQTHEESHLEDLLLALAELRDQEWSTVVILEEEIEEAREMIETFNLKDSVTILPEPTRRERVAVYRGADIFVQTANECPYAAELLWSMASGCIGVVQYQPDSSAHELVIGHEYGVRVSNPDELADGLIEASEKPMSTYEPYFSQYDVGAIVEKVTDSYTQLIDRTD